jgi:hypothetical protein
VAKAVAKVAKAAKKAEDSEGDSDDEDSSKKVLDVESPAKLTTGKAGKLKAIVKEVEKATAADPVEKAVGAAK